MLPFALLLSHISVSPCLVVLKNSFINKWIENLCWILAFVISSGGNIGQFKFGKVIVVVVSCLLPLMLNSAGISSCLLHG